MMHDKTNVLIAVYGIVVVIETAVNAAEKAFCQLSEMVKAACESKAAQKAKAALKDLYTRAKENGKRIFSRMKKTAAKIREEGKKTVKAAAEKMPIVIDRIKKKTAEIIRDFQALKKELEKDLYIMIEAEQKTE